MTNSTAPTFHVLRATTDARLPYDELVLDLNPTRYMKLDPYNEPFLTAKDYADQGVDGRIFGYVGPIAPTVLPGDPGTGAVYFGGTTGGVQVGDPGPGPGDVDLAWVGWFRLEAGGSSVQVLMSLGPGGGTRDHFAVALNGGQPWAAVGADDTALGAALSVGPLHMLGASYRASDRRLTLNVDGVEVAAHNLAGPLNVANNHMRVACIDYSHTTTPDNNLFFRGDANHVSLHPRWIGPEKFTLLYESGTLGAAPPGPDEYVGELRGVLNEPVFASQLFGGFSPLDLILDHYPSELEWFDKVRVDGPHGVTVGIWKHEDREVERSPDGRTYKVTLVPLVAELSESGFTANFTSDATQTGPALGPVEPSTWSLTALARTRSCSAGIVEDVGQPFGYAFNDAQPTTAFEQHCLDGGPGWWWFCDGMGVVDVRATAPVTHKLVMGRDVEKYTETADTHSLVNGIKVSGGTPAGGSRQLTAEAVDLLLASPYRVQRIGRRYAAAYQDTSLLDQASVQRVADMLLSMLERPAVKRSLSVRGWEGGRIEPGHAVTIHVGDPDPTDLKTGKTLGPFTVQYVTRQGVSGDYDLDVVDVVSTVASGGGGGVTAPKVALSSLIRNPGSLTAPLVYTPGLQPVDATHRAELRFEVPANTISVHRAILSFSLLPFRGAGHSHMVFKNDGSGGSGSGPFNIRDVQGRDSTGAGTAWSIVTGFAIPVDDIYTFEDGGGGLTNPSLHDAGMAQDVEVWVDNGQGLVDWTGALGGPWGTGVALDVSDIDITAMVQGAGWKEIQLASSEIGAITPQLMVFAVLGGN